MIPIFEPFLTGNEERYLKQCFETNWISSQGAFIKRFEDSLAEYHSVKHAITTSNCTTALHLTLKAFGIGKGDEVICPDLTFIAPANMVRLAGADLVLVDVDPKTLTLDVFQLEDSITPRTKAIIVVHQFGHSADMDPIVKIAKKYNLKVIEDNAESLGGRYKEQLLGTIGDAACYSFFANKIITTGEGGAVLTDDDTFAKQCMILRDHGMSLEKRYDHIALGYNYRMTNMQAAVGLGQLEQLDSILVKRKQQMQWYYEAFESTDGVGVREFAAWCTPVHWLMTITLDLNYSSHGLIDYMRKREIDCRPMIKPVHIAKHFKEDFRDSDFPNSIRSSAQSLHLPSSTSLTHEQVEFIVDCVKSFLEETSNNS